jgi:hypothetical protein
MNLTESLYKRLHDDGAVAAVVVARIFPIKAGQDETLPLLVFQILGGPVEHQMGTDDGPRSTRVQITGWGKTLAEAKAAAGAARTCVKDFTGSLGGSGGVAVERIFLDSEPIEGFDEVAGVEGLYYERFDALIWYVEA